MQTQNTIRAGLFAFVSAGLWLVTAGLYVLMVVFDNQWQLYYALFSATLIAAGVLGLLTMFGVGRRLGGLGVIGTVGLGITGLGVAVSIIAWAVPLWMVVQGTGHLVFGSAVLRRGAAPKQGTLLASSGLIIGAIVFLVLNLAEIGWRDSYGDYPLAWALGVVAGVVFLPLGLIGWGRWLRSEESVDMYASSIPA